MLELISSTELRARALNSKALGQRKNVNLPGVHVQLPVLSAQDISDLQDFACRNKMDFVAASFVQVRGAAVITEMAACGHTRRALCNAPAWRPARARRSSRPPSLRPSQTADDVRFIRRVLDEAGGQAIQILSKIESQAGLQHYDSILQVRGRGLALPALLSGGCRVMGDG